MSLVVDKRPAARRDLADVFYQYVSEGTIKTARRFSAQAESTFQRLAKMPSLGAQYDPDDLAYAGLRYMPVSRFPTYLVFYFPVPGGIEVMRVLHGARDIQGILASELE